MAERGAKGHGPTVNREKRRGQGLCGVKRDPPGPGRRRGAGRGRGTGENGPSPRVGKPGRARTRGKKRRDPAPVPSGSPTVKDGRPGAGGPPGGRGGLNRLGRGHRWPRGRPSPGKRRTGLRRAHSGQVRIAPVLLGEIGKTTSHRLRQAVETFEGAWDRLGAKFFARGENGPVVAFRTSVLDYRRSAFPRNKGFFPGVGGTPMGRACRRLLVSHDDGPRWALVGPATFPTHQAAGKTREPSLLIRQENVPKNWPAGTLATRQAGSAREGGGRSGQGF